ncbi:MAG: hypothetical protein OEV64_12880 [Desulfobulbaceae bacterium]|nr:hypothetical protein [Desulfobulbaceae bacterium]
MNPLEAIIFPQTLPVGANYLPLLHFFDSLVYCVPVEDEARAVSFDQRYRFVAPAPLGADRDRFLRLVSDLEGKGAHYADQVGHLSLAGFTDPAGRGRAERKGDILSELLHPKADDRSLVEKKELVLWQARLVLKLGEMYDKQQVSLEEELRRVIDSEDSLFDELRKEEDLTFAFTKQLGGFSEKNSALDKHRLKAWTRLFVLGDMDVQGPLVLATVDRNGFEELVDIYEASCGERLEELAGLLLPVESGDPESRRDEGEKGKILNSLRAALVDPAGVGEWETMVGRWNELLDPDDQEGNCSVFTPFRFPGVGAKKLLLRAFGHSDELSAMAGDIDRSHLVVGVLEESGKR